MRGPGVSFVMVILAVSIGACAMFETRETKLQPIKRIGIISAVGDEITFARAGLTGLDTSRQSFPIGSWGLDDLIVQQATAALSGRFQVQPVSYKRAAFAMIEKDSPVAPVNFIRGDPFKKLVETEVSPQGLDAYIVITKAKANFGGGDGKTFDVIEKMAAAPLDSAEPVRLPGPSRLVDESFSPRSGDPARNESLHRAITDLIARSLPTTLSDMHLAETR